MESKAACKTSCLVALCLIKRTRTEKCPAGKELVLVPFSGRMRRSGDGLMESRLRRPCRAGPPPHHHHPGRTPRPGLELPSGLDPPMGQTPTPPLTRARGGGGVWYNPIMEEGEGKWQWAGL